MQNWPFASQLQCFSSPAHPLASNRAKGRPTHLQIPSFSTTGNRAEATSFRRAPPISRAQARTPHLTSSAGGEGGPPPSQEEEAAEWDNGRCADHKGEKWRCLLHIPPRGWWRGTVEAGARGFFFRAAASSSSSLPPATSGGGRGRRARPPPLRPPPPPPSPGPPPPPHPSPGPPLPHPSPPWDRFT